MKYGKTAMHLLLTFIIVLLIPVSAFASETEERYSFGHFYYHSHEGYVSVCGYLGRETEVEIPSSIAGKPVSEVESGSFDGCSSIQTIIIPDTVVMVYEDSFTGASSLNKIISHTTDVEIKAGSGVIIEYANDTTATTAPETSANTDNTTPETSSERENTTQATTSESDNTTPETSSSNTTPAATEAADKTEAADISNNDTTADSPSSTTTAASAAQDTSATTDSGEGIGDYVYEEDVDLSEAETAGQASDQLSAGVEKTNHGARFIKYVLIIAELAMVIALVVIMIRKK